MPDCLIPEAKQLIADAQQFMADARAELAAFHAVAAPIEAFVESLLPKPAMMAADDRCFGKARNPGWDKLDKETIAAHPWCARCGNMNVGQLETHHLESFHEHPEKEMDPKNLEVVCMGPLACHFQDHLCT